MTTEQRTRVVATGTIGPPGPPGDPGPPGEEPGPQGPRGIGGPIFTMEGDLQVKVGKLKWRNLGGTTIERVVPVVGTAPVGDDVIIDVLKNGVTLFATAKPTIADGATYSGGFVPDSTSLVDGDEITVDILQVGSSTLGSDLTVEIFLT